MANNRMAKCHPDRISVSFGLCNQCNLIRWYADHKTEYLAKRVAQNRQHREDALKHYGGVCACCGESRYEFLAIDHINGGGTQHHKQIRTPIVRWLRKNNYPEGFRVLCHNCNQSLGQYGYCPHSLGAKVTRPEDGGLPEPGTQVEASV
jgi:hypothetical protein